MMWCVPVGSTSSQDREGSDDAVEGHFFWGGEEKIMVLSSALVRAEAAEVSDIEGQLLSGACLRMYVCVRGSRIS